jgi:hypothetical protein
MRIPQPFTGGYASRLSSSTCLFSSTIPCLKPSAQLQFLTCHTIVIAIEVIRVARILLQDPLCLFVGCEVGAVQVAIY